jgi:hypothetical protein
MKIPLNDEPNSALVFLKLYPDLPMLDIAATEFATLLVGPQLPWIELVKIHDAENIYPAIFCQGIHGEMITGHDFDEFHLLDPEGYSKRVLVGLFLNQEDGKDSNFILKKNKIRRPNLLV